MKSLSRLSLVAAAAALAACAGAHARRSSAPSASSASASAIPAAGGLTDAGRAVSEPAVRGDQMVEIAELKTVLFAYDSDRLDSVARKTLRANAAWLKAHPDAKIQVAGHCDQRGTVAYNLALGQRRAAAVRGYYRHLGVDASRVATISYGKQKPLCEDMTESCWSRNRRAQTLKAVEAKVAQP